MADLIIKPSSGGSLKLQEDGGTDAISINTSGVATLANATITAGTLASGVTGGSGLTIYSSAFYNAENTDQHTYTLNGYSTSRNLESYSSFVSGVIPAGMTSIVDIKAYTIDGQNTGGTNQVLKWEWDMGGNGEGSSTHSLAETSIGSWAQAANTNRSHSLMAANASPNRFEELASAGDAFGMRFNRTQGISLYLIGVLITYKIKE